jgi:hypothetical protein
MGQTKTVQTGTISANHSHSKQPIWSFDYCLDFQDRPRISDVLMSTFKDLKLSQEEKINLTCQCREELHFYRSLSADELAPYIEKLKKNIQKHGRHQSHIKASGFGAVICMAAIFSGELNSKKSKISFELSDVPLKLFPQDWINTQNLSPQISLEFMPSQTWLSTMKSLTELPSYFPMPKTAKRSSSAKRVA